MSAIVGSDLGLDLVSDLRSQIGPWIGSLRSVLELSYAIKRNNSMQQ